MKTKISFKIAYCQYLPATFTAMKKTSSNVSSLFTLHIFVTTEELDLLNN